ncbi:phosphotransferase family protein [Actinopolymorpha pittospori]
MTEQDTDLSVRAGRPGVVALVIRLLGSEPSEVRRTSSPDAWFADLSDGRTVVVKGPGWLNRPGSPRVEAWAYAECAKYGIRTAKVLALSEDPECLIVERLRGEALPERGPSMSAADRAVWARAGEDLRAIHEIRVRGFGPLVPGPGEPCGEAARWCPFAERARMQGIPWLVDAGFLSTTEADRLLARFEEASPSFAQVIDGRLLHGDLQCVHVFRSGTATYEGIIDFGQAQSGDPRWDLARIPLWDGDEALDAVLEGYGPESVTEEDRALLLPLYLLSFVVHHAVGHGRQDYVRMLLDRSGYSHLL